jgi:hypothetical protein
MKVLKGILAESEAYYIEAEKRLRQRIAGLPKGSIKKRVIKGKTYWYLQRREGKKISHKYAGKNKPLELINKIIERKKLKNELKTVLASLKLLKKTKDIKHDRHNK